MAGRLQGTYLGRPVEIEADGRNVLLRVPSLRAAWGLRRCVTANTIFMLRSIRENKVRLRLRIGSRLAVNVLPVPHIALRVLVPSLNFSET
jgi:hypothetical protein